MRVLMVTERLIVGGAEMTALELAGALKERGWQVVVAAIRGGGALRDAFVRSGVEVCDGLAHNRFDLSAAVRIARIIRRKEIESVIVVDVLRNGMLFAALGSILSGRRVGRICWCHSVPGGQAGRFVRWLRWYKAAGLLDAVVCVSHPQRRRIISEGMGPRGLPVIHNGVDLSRFAGPAGTDLPLPTGKQIVVQVANVVPDKDFKTLVEAAARLAGMRDDFHLVLVGRGTDSGEMVRAVERAGLGGAVTLAGRRDDVPGILAAADVLVLSTKTESFGIAVLEGMAAGLPVIVSDVPAFEDFVTDGVEGLKVPPGDADALTRAIARLLDDKTLRRRLADAGQKRAEDFGVARMADKFHRLLSSFR